MYEFSVEQTANNIFDSRTREIFKETMNSYFNGNYRSAIVGVWTIVICDVLFKLMYLRDIHNDAKAKDILDYVKDFQDRSPNNPQWEINLLKKVFSETNLLESTEYDAIETIQKHRHLCAHPILKSTELLFQPNREMALFDIRTALDAVLTKPPILTKKIFDELVEDMEKVKDLFPGDDQLKRYVYSRYLFKLNGDVLVHLFRSLWRITFKVEEKRCDDNRKINYRTLRIMYEHNRELIGNCIKDNAEYFSQISSGTPTRYLIFFLGDYPNLYGYLNDSAKEILKSIAISSVDLYAISYFMNENIKKHIANICTYIDIKQKKAYGTTTKICDNHLGDVFMHAKSAGVLPLMNSLYTTMYINSTDFNTADELFKHVEGNLDEYTREDMELLLKGIDNNNQTYWRGRASSDHQKVVDRCKVLFGAEFDPTSYRL